MISRSVLLVRVSQCPWTRRILLFSLRALSNQSWIHISLSINTSFSLRNTQKSSVLSSTRILTSRLTPSIRLTTASRLRILSALPGTRWGQQNETLLDTYKSLIHSIIFCYVAQVWYPKTVTSKVINVFKSQNST